MATVIQDLYNAASNDDLKIKSYAAYLRKREADAIALIEAVAKVSECTVDNFDNDLQNIMDEIGWDQKAIFVNDKGEECWYYVNDLLLSLETEGQRGIDIPLGSVPLYHGAQTIDPYEIVEADVIINNMSDSAALFGSLAEAIETVASSSWEDASQLIANFSSTLALKYPDMPDVVAQVGYQFTEAFKNGVSGASDVIKFANSLLGITNYDNIQLDDMLINDFSVISGVNAWQALANETEGVVGKIVQVGRTIASAAKNLLGSIFGSIGNKIKKTSRVLATVNDAWKVENELGAHCFSDYGTVFDFHLSDFSQWISVTELRKHITPNQYLRTDLPFGYCYFWLDANEADVGHLAIYIVPLKDDVFAKYATTSNASGKIKFENGVHATDPDDDWTNFHFLSTSNAYTYHQLCDMIAGMKYDNINSSFDSDADMYHAIGYAWSINMLWLGMIIRADVDGVEDDDSEDTDFTWTDAYTLLMVGLFFLELEDTRGTQFPYSLGAIYNLTNLDLARMLTMTNDGSAKPLYGSVLTSLLQAMIGRWLQGMFNDVDYNAYCYEQSVIEGCYRVYTDSELSTILATATIAVAIAVATTALVATSISLKRVVRKRAIRSGNQQRLYTSTCKENEAARREILNDSTKTAIQKRDAIGLINRSEARYEQRLYSYDVITGWITRFSNAIGSGLTNVISYSVGRVSAAVQNGVTNARSLISGTTSARVTQGKLFYNDVTNGDIYNAILALSEKIPAEQIGLI